MCRQTSCCLLLTLWMNLFVAGCAHHSLPLLSSPQEQAEPTEQHESVLLVDLPFYPQTRYHCGPAVMAMLISHYHEPIHPDQIADSLYLPKRKGSYTVEMRAVARQHQLIPYPLSPRSSVRSAQAELSRLKANIKRGQPVVVLQNLRVSFWPKWHYSIVVGFDEAANTVVLTSGNRRVYRVPESLFLSTWEKADYWAMVPLPAQRLPAQLAAPSMVAALEGMVEVGHVSLAETAYKHAIREHPKSVLLHFGAGFLAHQKQQWKRAHDHYHTALSLAPGFTPVLNNLAYIYHEMGEYEQAINVIERALLLEPDNKGLRESYRELKR